MALANQAALLDELMGVYRNSSDSKVMKWNEDIVCKYYLAGFCPHELFMNTKEQLGPCPNHHDQNLLAKYKESSRFQRMGFEKQLQTYLERFIQRREARILVNRERINESPLSGMEVKKIEIIEKHKTDIGEMIEKIESLANEGKIGESQQLFTQLEDKKNTLKYDEIEFEKQRMAAKVKEDEVCEVCGAMVSKNDLRSSVDNHENGRIHCGYLKIDEVLVSLKELIAKIDERTDESRDDKWTEVSREDTRNGDNREDRRNSDNREDRKNGHSREDRRNGESKEERRNGDNSDDRRKSDSRDNRRKDESREDRRKNESREDRRKVESRDDRRKNASRDDKRNVDSREDADRKRRRDDEKDNRKNDRHDNTKDDRNSDKRRRSSSRSRRDSKHRSDRHRESSRSRSRRY